MKVTRNESTDKYYGATANACAIQQGCREARSVKVESKRESPSDMLRGWGLFRFILVGQAACQSAEIPVHGPYGERLRE